MIHKFLNPIVGNHRLKVLILFQVVLTEIFPDVFY